MTDTIADFVEAISMGLPIQAPPAIRKYDRLPDNLDDFETPEDVMAVVDKRREEIIAAEERRRGQRHRTDNAAVGNEETDELPPDGT